MKIWPYKKKVWPTLKIILKYYMFTKQITKTSKSQGPVLLILSHTIIL